MQVKPGNEHLSCRQPPYPNVGCACPDCNKARISIGSKVLTHNSGTLVCPFCEKREYFCSCENISASNFIRSKSTLSNQLGKGRLYMPSHRKNLYEDEPSPEFENCIRVLEDFFNE